MANSDIHIRVSSVFMASIINSLNVLLQISFSWKTFIFLEELSLKLIIYAVFFPHELILCVVLHVLSGKRCNHKLNICVICFSYELTRCVALNFFCLNTCNHKWSICVVFSFMNWLDVFCQIWLPWRTFVWFVFLMNWWNVSP